MDPTTDTVLRSHGFNGSTETHCSLSRILRHVGEVGRLLESRVATDNEKPQSAVRVPCVCAHSVNFSKAREQTAKLLWNGPQQTPQRAGNTAQAR